MNELLTALRRSKVYDLGQPYYVGMPHYPTHPPFLFGLTKKHGDMVADNGMSSAADAIALGSHVGTHIDALCHFSCGGKLYGGVEVKTVQSAGGGIHEHSVDTIAPILRRGVLLDIAGLCKVESLATDFAIAPDHLAAAAKTENVAIERGDVVLLRTGWARFWEDAARYITGGKGTAAAGPGPELEGARWLSERGVFAAGSDTVAFERAPTATMPVHVHLLVESGIHIIEALNLEDLARDRVYEFVFVGAPMKIRGATGSPLRPLAIY
ncbi:MAG TPA: cyclase family protein [Bryobacteraceae bacterium]|nr:cyclase family protein [Bryobacteraceae bacterium]